MKLVRFNREMAPYARGDTRAVPDDVANRLIAAGEAAAEPSVFDVPALAERRGRRIPAVQRIRELL